LQRCNTSNYQSHEPDGGCGGRDARTTSDLCAVQHGMHADRQITAA
jgi:hypothetical protein